MRFVLDADVPIGALDGGDPHHLRAHELLTAWRDDEARSLVSVVNLTEVLISPAGDSSNLATAREAITALGVVVHAPNEAIGVDAARLRRRHPISLPDAYCLATARYTSSTLVSFDRRLERAATVEGITALGQRDITAPEAKKD